MEGLAAVHNDVDDENGTGDNELEWGCNGDATRSGRTQMHLSRPSFCCQAPGGATTHFRRKLQMALRTALGAGTAALLSLLYWAWGGEASWFTIIICILSTRGTMVSCRFVWHAYAP